MFLIKYKIVNSNLCLLSIFQIAIEALLFVQNLCAMYELVHAA